MAAGIYPSLTDKNKCFWRPMEMYSPRKCPVPLAAAWTKNTTSIVQAFVIPTAHGSRMCRGRGSEDIKVHSGVCLLYILKVTSNTVRFPSSLDWKVWLSPDPLLAGGRQQTEPRTLLWCCFPVTLTALPVPVSTNWPCPPIPAQHS